jgi:hypothetical protein
MGRLDGEVAVAAKVVGRDVVGDDEDKVGPFGVRTCKREPRRHDDQAKQSK